MKNTYIVKNGNEFIGVDSGSGYPYSTSIFNAKVFDKLGAASEWMQASSSLYPSARVVKLKVSFEEISDEDMQHEIYEHAMSKLTDEEKRILGLS